MKLPPPWQRSSNPDMVIKELTGLNPGLGRSGSCLVFSESCLQYSYVFDRKALIFGKNFYQNYCKFFTKKPIQSQFDLLKSFTGPLPANKLNDPFSLSSFQ